MEEGGMTEVRRISLIQEYVIVLSKNLGMLHFGCRTENGIAQPRDTVQNKGYLFVV